MIVEIVMKDRFNLCCGNNISEVIEMLQIFMDRYGDLPLYYYSDDKYVVPENIIVVDESDKISDGDDIIKDGIIMK
jgi:uncharacterized protein YjfI (DUF2170 family)